MATSWESRTKPATTWWDRIKPEVYITPLQDSYTEVADENNEVIYIYADSWKLIPLTKWTERETI